MTSRKRALVVHYFFPPLGGAGVPRILKFVKFLPQLGWDVTVITSGRASRWYGVRDDSLLADVPASVQVLRPSELPIASIRRRLRPPLERLGVPGLAHCIGWPDETSGWLPLATASARRVAREWRPDVVLSSSFAYTSHLVALAASRSAGVPWIADFRDPWTLNPQGHALPDALVAFNARAERALVRRADRLVVVDERLDLVGLDRTDRRRVVIRNGVDEDDFLLEGDDIQPPDDRFQLTYVGSLYGDRDAAPVIDALGRLVRRGRIDPGRFELSIVGNVWLSSRPTDDVLPIKVAGYVDRAAALRAMRSATALLFYAPESTWAPSGKIFEYLVAGRPVLSVARRDNLAYQLVAELGAGAVATPSDPAGIERAVVELYDRWLDGSLTVGTRVREETLRRFSRRRLTTELVRTFEDAIAQPLDG